MTKRWRQGMLGIATLVAIAPFLAPEVLAFPYKQEFGADHVWSTAPIPTARMSAILTDANTRVAKSPLASGSEGRRIFLTDGGWRWRVLALQSHFAFGLTRALREDVILNRTDVQSDKVNNGLGDGRTRTITGVIAHEKCHGMERRHFGNFVDMTKPVWLREGYCDYVARESTLNADEVAAMKKSDPNNPALPYYEGRTRVTAILEANGGDVDELFAQTR
ncbi:hypothetical protein [Novosphingobium sp.]|uniref:hypothetical protein n=1 Tax=Novosphingobium sp. TaxID=1874826 RepID=UPI0025EB101A|nr:hypothetical protein [Novosphingobium sp.]MCC6925443.1 hypothetical protein [Novosphingobium sp.]